MYRTHGNSHEPHVLGSAQVLNFWVINASLGFIIRAMLPSLWLVLQKLLILCYCIGSVGLVIDNPEFFNRLAGKFCSNATMRFIVLLWGEKSCLANNETLGVPVFSYKEMVKLGRENRAALINSIDASKFDYIFLQNQISSSPK